MKKNLFATLFLAAVFFSAPLFISASVASLSVLPSQIEYNGKPGTASKNSISVINNGVLPVKLKIRAEDFKFINEKGDLDFYIASADSASTWLVPQYLEVNIPAFGTKKVEYIISIPKGISAGGHLGAITFELENSANENNETLKNNKFGTLIFLNVIDFGITTGGVISNFSTPKIQFTSSPNLNLTLKNLGNANLAVKGSVVFTDWQGKKVAQFAADNIIAAPNNNRNFGMSWSNNNLFGFYRAQVDLVNSIRNDQKLSASTWTVILPWQKIIIIIPLLLLAIFISVFIAVKINQNRKKKAYDPTARNFDLFNIFS